MDPVGCLLNVTSVDEAMDRLKLALHKRSIGGHMGVPDGLLEGSERPVKRCETVGLGQALLAPMASLLQIDDGSHMSNVHPGYDMNGEGLGFP